MPRHADLEDAGQIPHHVIDDRLAGSKESNRLALIGNYAPRSVSGARDDPEAALANLLAALETLGLIDDNTSAS